jgi:hypothetical protein
MTSVADVVVTLDEWYERLSARLEGVSAEELAWEPAPGIPSISWRVRHIATDCLGAYAEGIFDAGPPVTSDDPVADLHREWETYRTAMLADPDPGRELGAAFGPFSEASRLGLHLHALDELAHHGGEIGLLRDLWAARA